VVPPEPGLFSAYGLLVADFTHTFVRALLTRLDQLEYERLQQALALLTQAALRVLKREGFARAQTALQVAADLRYLGQAHEVVVSLPALSVSRWRDQIARRFHQRHRALYGFAAPEPIELVNLRLTAIGRVPKPALAPHRPPATGKQVPASRRDVFFDEQAAPTSCPIYARPHLPIGAQLAGPAIIEQYDATTVVPPGWQAAVDASGALVVER
jgi:N-methylhydantoinase A